jgi:diguanylate cyclase (GGDEF)-like protein
MSVDRAPTVLCAEVAAARVLRRAGYQVLEALDGRDLIDKIADSSPDAVVSDAVLPGGLDVCRRAGAIPILLVVAGSDAAARVEGLRAGADDVLSRPYDAEELKARVEALLRRRGRDGTRPAPADLDPVTGLPGPRALARRLEEALAAAGAANEPLSLMAIEVDEPGGRHGRAAGDRLLRECARAVVRACRDDDLVARAGGDELVVLLPGLHFGGSVPIADRVWREVGATQIVEAGARIACAAAIGVASFPGKDVESARDLLRFARAALARARAEGRGICLVQHHGYLYQPDVQPHVTT